MAFLYPLYTTEREALRTIHRGGGLVPLWTRGMIEAGIPEADDARIGDVAVIAAPQDAGPDETCAICTGERWAMIGVKGLIFAPAEPLQVWRP